MIEFRFSLNLSERQLLKYYSGKARVVHIKDKRGKTMQFPAEVLQPFVTHDGVCGEFIMRVDDNYKFIDIRKIESSDS